MYLADCAKQARFRRQARWRAHAPVVQPLPPGLLQRQEQIKGPENGSIARFDRLCCYQSGSETAMVSGRRQRLGIAGNALAGFGRVKGMAQAGLRQCCFWAARLQPQLQPVTRIPQFAA